MKILVTGASGFIGSFIVEEALRRGMEVWAGMRRGSSHAYLQDSRIRFIELDLSSTERLQEQLGAHTFDYVVHAAGATKCASIDDFRRINTEGTRHLVEAIRRTGMPLKRLVFISSLSVMGAVAEEEPHRDITPDDTPQPNTAYGRSKLEAEQWLAANAGSLPYVILRPTGVYGPRERDYFLQIKNIKWHIDFAVGRRQQHITFIYVADLVEAVFLALEKGRSGASYFLSDGKVYDSRQFSDDVAAELGLKWCLHLTAPLWLLRIVTNVGDWWARHTGRLTPLNRDKYNILCQRNWRCDISKARQELGYDPRFDLKKGVELSVAWYKEQHWL